jgi:hypothetical protein
MTGGQPDRIIPTEPDPSPTPVMAVEIQSAKSKVRKKKKGRSQNILAGRMMAGRRNILNTGTVNKLGGARKLTGADFMKLRFGGGL